MNRIPRLSRLGLALALGIAGVIGARHLVHASDHQDTADVELNPSQDLTDFYAFPGATSDRIALVLNSWPVITPAQAGTVSFDPNLLYQIKVDNSGDAVEDKVIQVTFTGTGASQQVQVRGPMTPPVVGAMNNTVATTDPVVTGAINMVIGTSSGIQVYAGVRDDPFFIDFEQFFRILPDRKPVTGSLAALPSTPSASAFRSPGQAVDFLAGFNVLSIVVELPTSMLTAGGNAKIGLWGTISR
ncbi:MAG: DUF4331 family protein [Gemmatimonadota bacterium]